MALFRLYAYSVEPQRTVSEADFVAPAGGAVATGAALRSALDAALGTARAERPTSVSLRVDPDPKVRTSPIRDAVMQVAFAVRTESAEAAAEGLAERLSRAMDNRSPACLFLAAAYRESAATPSREVALW